MFVNKKDFLYYQDNQLLLFSQEKKIVAQLDFPVAIIKAMDIRDFTKFKQVLKDFLTTNSGTTRHWILVLGEDKYFSKTFPQDENLAQHKQTFLEEVPFERSQLLVKEITKPDSCAVFVVYNQVLKAITEIAQELGCHLDGVFPQVGFEVTGVLDNQGLAQLDAVKIDWNKWNLQDLTDEETRAESKVPSKKIVAAAFLLVLLLAAGLYFFLFRSKPGALAPNDVAKTNASPAAQVEEASSPAQESTPAPQLVASTKKEDIKVTILNGSGVQGQASKVRSTLASLGFINFQLGNAASFNLKETMVTYSDSVSDQIIDEVVANLEKEFTQITRQEDPKRRAEIVITTGQPNP